MLDTIIVSRMLACGFSSSFSYREPSGACRENAATVRMAAKASDAV